MMSQNHKYWKVTDNSFFEEKKYPSYVTPKLVKKDPKWFIRFSLFLAWSQRRIRIEKIWEVFSRKHLLILAFVKKTRADPS